MNYKLSRLLAAPLLIPLSFVYRAIISGRNFLYDAGLAKAYKSQIPIISVGNITAGGNGKTPLAMHLYSYLKQKGMDPVILSRGYKGREVGPTIVLSDDSSAQVGDEPKLMASRGHVVIVSKDKVAGVKHIESRKLGNIIILDDGLQSRSLSRNLDLLSVEVTSPVAYKEIVSGDILPWGMLREPVKGALQRVKAVVGNIGSGTQEIKKRFSDICKLFNKELPTYTATVVTTQVVGLFSKQVLLPTSINLLSSIAKPEKVVETLSSIGFTVENRYFFPDHHRFSQSEVQKIIASSPLPIVCTEKDAVKLSELDSLDKADIYVVVINLIVEPELSKLLSSVLSKGVE